VQASRPSPTSIAKVLHRFDVAEDLGQLFEVAPALIDLFARTRDGEGLGDANRSLFASHWNGHWMTLDSPGSHSQSRQDPRPTPAFSHQSVTDESNCSTDDGNADCIDLRDSLERTAALVLVCTFSRAFVDR
jgi:hypothetical protein